jgi:hypothetical protein
MAGLPALTGFTDDTPQASGQMAAVTFLSSVRS